MTVWLVITAIGVGSYAMRAVMLALVGLKPLPARFDTAMRHVGPAAIGALIVTMALTRAGTIRPVPLPELAAIATPSSRFDAPATCCTRSPSDSRHCG